MKKARKFLVLFMTLAIAVSVSVTNLTLSAFAADPVPASSASNITVPTDLYVGKTISSADIVGITHVRDPKGSLTEIGGGYTFKQAGYYTFAIVADGVVVYEGYRTEVAVDDVTLKVNASKIPTYAKKGVEIKLPTATMIDEDGKTVDASGYTFTYKYTTASGETETADVAADATEWSIPAEKVAQAGSYFVTYTAKTAADAVTYRQNYTVQVQDNFEDKTDPTLNFSGVPSNANILSKVTLPTATATDNFDADVEITVTVKGPDGAVVYQMEKKDYKVDYVYENGEKVEAVFDNADNMSFYPDTKGRYIVTYTATDDSGNKTESIRAINVSDKLPPEIDVQTPELIPSKWGVTTYNNTNQAVGSFTIPVAYIYDNSALPTTAESVGEGDDKVYVASVIIKKDSTKIFDSTTTGDLGLENNKYGNFLTKQADGSYAFKLSEFKPKNGDKTGSYTITYKAVDAQNLTTTKDYKVTVSSGSVHYDVIPSISYDKLPDYLVAGEKFGGFDITIDSTNVDEGNNVSNVSVAQEIKYFFKGADGEYEEIDIDDEYTLPESTGTVKVTVTAKDAYGNIAEENLEKEIDVIDFKHGQNVSFNFHGNTNESYTYDRDSANAAYDFLSADSATTIKAGEDAAANKYVGFEVYLGYRADANAEMTFSSLDTEVVYSKDTNGILTLKSAKIRPTKQGLYTLVVRAFDQGATGVIETKTVDVSVIGNDGPIPETNTKSASSSSQVDAYSAQTLSYNLADWKNYDALEVTVKGTRFAVMDKRFVPMDTASSYQLKYKLLGSKTVDIGSETITTNSGSSSDFAFKEITDQFTITNGAGESKTVEYAKYRDNMDVAKYDAAVDAAAGDQWKLDQAMAEYLFPVPEVSVISKVGAVELDVKVYDPSSEEVKIEKDSAGNLYFRNTTDGTYTIKYTAKSAKATSDTYEITVTSGDILKPELTVKTIPSASARKDYKFKFSDISGNDNITESADLTYKRTIKYPDDTVKTDSYKDASKSADYTLDQVGVYTVTYAVTDKAGNTTTVEYTIEVTDKKAKSVNSQMISTVLIVVAALLIVGLLVYFFAFRKVDMDKKKKSNNNDKK